MEAVEKILKDILTAIVINPEAIETRLTKETDEIGELDVIYVKVHKNDVGLCIGKGGNTAEALRTIVQLAGFKSLGQRVHMHIDAPRSHK